MLAIFFIAPRLVCYLFIFSAFFSAIYAWRNRQWSFFWCMMFGMGIGYGRAAYYPHRLLPSGVIRCTGRIISIPQHQNRLTRFDFSVITVDQKPVHFALRVQWYGDHPYLQVQDQWSLRLRVKEKQPLRNPGEIDYNHLLEISGLDGQAIVMGGTHFKPALLKRFDSIESIDVLRQRIAERIHHAVSDTSLAATLVALTTGSRHLLEKSDWQVFQNTGTSHLIAISGLHVSLVAGLFYGIFSFLWRRSRRLALLFPAQKIGALVGLLSAILYSVLAGLSLPTQRSLVMIGVMLGSELCHRYIPLWYRWLLAFVIVVWIWPISVLSVSFWLSYMAVFLIGWCISARIGTRRGLWGWTYLQGAMCIGLIPMTLLFFGRVSVVMLCANYIAIPYMSFLVVPFCLLGTLGFFMGPVLDDYVWKASALILSPLWWYLSHLGSWTHVMWAHSIQSNVIFMSLGVGTLLLLLPFSIPGKGLVIIFFLPLFFSTPTFDAVEDIAKITIFDVGSGLMLWVHTPRDSVMVTAHVYKPYYFMLLQRYLTQMGVMSQPPALSREKAVWSWPGGQVERQEERGYVRVSITAASQRLQVFETPQGAQLRIPLNSATLSTAQHGAITVQISKTGTVRVQTML